MANCVAFLIIWVLTFAIASSMNLPFEPDWLVVDPKDEMMAEPESVRRVLAGRGYISYGAMQKNNVPCNQRGQSYYDCKSRGKANPYSRGCNVITRCGGR
ncbi:Rapid ALkalinization Factor [Cynara cardunculus var. scolymus]|uniref:Rapid ALkalinization Factor n=1 Tax=Cynara cardunculus var. scolymus TaxID=59895 RepID=A0A103Y485_CYNCS|nr:Rapid ALkalinization Factor [Cynara cardunculus var. scolymus]